MHARGIFDYRNISGWKLSAVYVNQTKLNVNSSTKVGGHTGGLPKIRGGWTWPTQAAP